MNSVQFQMPYAKQIVLSYAKIALKTRSTLVSKANLNFKGFQRKKLPIYSVFFKGLTWNVFFFLRLFIVYKLFMNNFFDFLLLLLFFSIFVGTRLEVLSRLKFRLEIWSRKTANGSIYKSYKTFYKQFLSFAFKLIMLMIPI